MPRRRCLFRLHERPVRRIFASLQHPATKQVAFRFGELFIRIRRRHRGISVCDAYEQFAFLWVIRIDCAIAAQVVIRVMFNPPSKSETVS